MSSIVRKAKVVLCPKTRMRAKMSNIERGCSDGQTKSTYCISSNFRVGIKTVGLKQG